MENDNDETSQTKNQMKNTNKNQNKNDCILNHVSSPSLLQSFTVKSVDQCHHISYVTSNLVWASDHKHNLVLTNTTGETLRHLTDLCSSIDGSHSVTNKGELIYIDTSCNINKLSNDMKTNKTLIEHMDSIWIKRSLYWSPLNGDLLIGMSFGIPLFSKDRVYTHKSKVARYDQKGKVKQSIEFDSRGLELYKDPHKITENNNGDVVVSDWSGAVVVTEREGKHRFSYTGHPLGSAILPRGICTDALSNILVCDIGSKSIHLIDKNGHFLQFLLTTTEDEDIPWCVSCDTKNHRLWVGSPKNNKICVYKYVTMEQIKKGKQCIKYAKVETLFSLKCVRNTYFYI